MIVAPPRSFVGVDVDVGSTAPPPCLRLVPAALVPIPASPGFDEDSLRDILREGETVGSSEESCEDREESVSRMSSRACSFIAVRGGGDIDSEGMGMCRFDILLLTCPAVKVVVEGRCEELAGGGSDLRRKGTTGNSSSS